MGYTNIIKYLFYSLPLCIKNLAQNICFLDLKFFKIEITIEVIGYMIIIQIIVLPQLPSFLCFSFLRFCLACWSQMEKVGPS